MSVKNMENTEHLKATLRFEKKVSQFINSLFNEEKDVSFLRLYLILYVSYHFELPEIRETYSVVSTSFMRVSSSTLLESRRRICSVTLLVVSLPSNAPNFA